MKVHKPHAVPAPKPITPKMGKASSNPEVRKPMADRGGNLGKWLHPKKAK